MSDFFDKLGAAARRAANSVSNEVSVAAEEQKLRENYQALGRLCYSARRTGRGLEGEQYETLCGKIEASLKRINELKQANDVTGTAESYADESDFETVD